MLSKATLGLLNITVFLYHCIFTPLWFCIPLWHYSCIDKFSCLVFFWVLSALPVQQLLMPGCWALTAALHMQKFQGSVKLTFPENQCHIMRWLENWKHLNNWPKCHEKQFLPRTGGLRQKIFFFQNLVWSAPYVNLPKLIGSICWSKMLVLFIRKYLTDPV